LSCSTAIAQPALTIYNQNFAVVRDTVPLDLKSGVNNVRYADATAQVEPDSVIFARPGRQTFAPDLGAELPATTPSRRNCCCRCSRQDD